MKKNTRKSNKDLSKFICYTCDERGHLARDCMLSTQMALLRLSADILYVGTQKDILGLKFSKTL